MMIGRGGTLRRAWCPAPRRRQSLVCLCYICMCCVVGCYAQLFYVCMLCITSPASESVNINDKVLMGWSNNTVNNLHQFITSLDTNITTTCVAE